jgi:hypothetical protein
MNPNIEAMSEKDKKDFELYSKGVENQYPK